jgi:alpha-tubulin suppressor-like RCC1 family protein
MSHHIAPAIQDSMTPRARARSFRPRFQAFLSGLAVLAIAGCQLEADVMDMSDVGASRSAIAVHNGLRLNGLGPNGVNLNGVNLNGVNLNGVNLNGVNLNGVNLNGVNLNGLFLNGVNLNGVNLNGVNLNGVNLNGVNLNGIAMSDISLDGTSLDTAQEDAMQTVFRYLAECALGPDQCITIYDTSDAALTYCGAEGLDTGWASGPPDLSLSGSMAMCVIAHATADGVPVEHSQVNLGEFKNLMGYLVQCALAQGDSVTIMDERNLPLVYQGALGLAPEWRDGPLSPLGRKKVSACLAARANGRGQTVQISMRGVGLQSDPVERDLYTTQEGAFWGDLFAPQPYVRACLADGGGLSGRVCAQSGTCGFELMGDCKVLCDSRDPSDLSYSDCAGETAVINTFLDLGKQVGFGVTHNCTREADDSLWCWGRNNVGQLGQGTTSQNESTPLEITALGHDNAEVSAGHSFSCARKDSGSLWCWGENSSGQLGDGTTINRSSPTQVASLASNVASIGMSERHGCANKTDGSLWCWGKNNAGAVGDGTWLDRSQPVPVTSLGYDVARVSAGTCAKSTCAIKNDGSLWCWGANQYGQVGDGTTANRSTPIAITADGNGDPFTDITDACSGTAHTCARKTDGTVWCWGQDSNYQIGDGSAPSNQSRTAPVQVALPALAAPSTLSCGCQHTCVVATDSTLWCWGDNSTGAVGNGTFTSSSSPIQVSSLDNMVVRVTATDDHTCATRLDGTVWCWGEDEYQVLMPQTTVSAPTLVDF